MLHLALPLADRLMRILDPIVPTKAAILANRKSQFRPRREMVMGRLSYEGSARVTKPKEALKELLAFYFHPVKS